MAINPNLFNFNQVNRGDVTPPGQLPAEETTRYVRVRAADGGWVYYRVDTPQGQGALRTAAPENVVDLPTAWGVTDGYHEPPPSPSQPSAPPQPQGQAPIGTPGGPSPSLQQPPTQPSAQNATDDAKNGLTTESGVPAQGRWIRVTPWGNGSDKPGVDVVREDSITGRRIMTTAGSKYEPVDTDWRHAGTGTPLPDELTTSEKFQAITRLPGLVRGSVVAWDANAPATLPTGEATKGHKVTFKFANGIEQSITFTRTNAEGKQSFQISGTPEINIDGYTGPDKQALQAAQQRLAEAQAQHQRAQAAGQDLQNANTAIENAEKEFNSLRGIGNVTNKDAQTMLLQAATQRQTEAQTASVVQGTQNQTFQNVLQYFRDRVGDEVKAYELAMAYYNNHTNVDANNNRLAVDAARAWTDAETAANTQRVSLSNTRLGQANQSFSDDIKSSMDMNQYLEPGSDKGFKAFMAMQAIRDARARKQGAFDVNDADLKFDPNKRLPNGIRAFANPSNPSFATYPTMQSMRDEGRSLASGFGADGRPLPPDHNSVVRPVATPQPGAPPRPGSSTPPPPPPAAPARPAGQSSAAPSTVSAAAGTGQNTGADGNERPDDIITYTQVGADGKTIMDPQTGRPRLFTTSRANWNGVDPETRATWTIQRADPAPTPLPPQAQGPDPSINPVTGEPTGLPQQQNDPFPPGVRVLPPPSPERPDDVLTFVRRDADGNVVGTARYTRETYDRMMVNGAVHPEWSLENAEPGSLYDIQEGGIAVPRSPVEPSGEPMTKIMMEDHPTVPQNPPTTTDVIGFDLFGNRRRPTTGPYASTLEMPKQVGQPMPNISDEMLPWSSENGPKPQPDRNIEFFVDTPLRYESSQENDTRDLWKHSPLPYQPNGAQSPHNYLREVYGQAIRNSRENPYPSYSPNIFGPQPAPGPLDRQDAYQPYVDQLRSLYNDAISRMTPEQRADFERRKAEELATSRSFVAPPDPTTTYRSPAAEYTQYELVDLPAEEERRRRERERQNMPFGLSDLLNGAFSF